MNGVNLEHRVRQAEGRAQTALLRMDGHETLCAERYGNIYRTLNRISSNIRWAVVTLLTGMGAILTKLLFFTS